jgi:hypothetical protein
MVVMMMPQGAVMVPMVEMRRRAAPEAEAELEAVGDGRRGGQGERGDCRRDEDAKLDATRHAGKTLGAPFYSAAIVRLAS